jgi:hypothetical protein
MLELGIGPSFSRSRETCPGQTPKPGLKPEPKPLFDEEIITNKVYDSCRRQDCLEIVALAAEPVHINDKLIEVGEVIPVPEGACSVMTGNFAVKKIAIADKEPSPFKKGFWDIQIRFVFEYDIAFRRLDKSVIVCTKASSVYDKTFCLFGSDSSDFVTTADVLGGESFDGGAPTVWVNAKAIALKAEFRCSHCDRKPVDVLVTIGLFNIVKLSRVVFINVQSRGFCVPRECDFNPTDPCEFFSSLDFPMDTFAPPAKN